MLQGKADTSFKWKCTQEMCIIFVTFTHYMTDTPGLGFGKQKCYCARARGKRCAFIRVVRRGRDSMDSLLFGVEEQDESSVPDSVLKSLLLQVDVYI